MKKVKSFALTICTISSLLLSGCLEGPNTGVIPQIKQDNIESKQDSLEFKVVSAGFYHTLAVDVNGDVWGWGDNESGQLGEVDSANSNVPIKISNLSKIVKVVGGKEHSVALREDGTVWSWGSNAFGELGVGTFEASTTPAQVKGIEKVIDIDANSNSTIALKEDGTVWVWGSNAYGELGREGDNSAVPVQVEGLQNISKISAGFKHFLAVQKDDGSIWAWGWNRETNLGVGSNEEIVNTPTKVKGLTGIIDVAGATGSIIALNKDGSVSEWGGGEAPPQEILKAGSSSIIGQGNFHSFAANKEGKLWSWGLNRNGQLGLGENVDKIMPVNEVKQITGVVSVSGGDGHSVALDKEGNVWTWGSNEYGQLGDGTNIDKSIPEKLTIIGNK